MLSAIVTVTKKQNGDFSASHRDFSASHKGLQMQRHPSKQQSQASLHNLQPALHSLHGSVQRTAAILFCCCDWLYMESTSLLDICLLFISAAAPSFYLVLVDFFVRGSSRFRVVYSMQCKMQDRAGGGREEGPPACRGKKRGTKSVRCVHNIMLYNNNII
jgi:hypothetical protein